MRKKIIGYYFLAVFCSLIVYSVYFLNLTKKLATQYFIATISATLLSLLIAWLASTIVINNYQKINWQPTKLGTISGGILGGILSFIYIIFILGSSEIGINLPLPFIFLTLIVGLSSGIVMGIYAATIWFLAIFLSIVTGSFIGVVSSSKTVILMSLAGSFLASSSLFSILIVLKALLYKPKKQLNIVSPLSQGKLASEIKSLLDLATRENNILTKTKIVRELEISPEVADEILKYAELNSLCQSYLDEENGSVKYKFDC